MQAGKEYDCPISPDFPQEQQQPGALVAVQNLFWSNHFWNNEYPGFGFGNYMRPRKLQRSHRSRQVLEYPDQELMRRKDFASFTWNAAPFNIE